MVVSVVRFFHWCLALLPRGYRLAQVIAKYTFSVRFLLPIGQPKQFSPTLFFKQTSYLIHLLAAISKPVLCHPIVQLDQFPTYLWVNATPPPSSGLVQSSSLFIMIRFMYPQGCISTIYLEEVPPPPHTHTDDEILSLHTFTSTTLLRGRLIGAPNDTEHSRRQSTSRNPKTHVICNTIRRGFPIKTVDKETIYRTKIKISKIKCLITQVV